MDLASRSSQCFFCDEPRGDGLASRLGHICSKCGSPQPLKAESHHRNSVDSPSVGGRSEVQSDGAEDYFSALGAPLRFKQDLSTLEDTFYALSRALHPDRFTAMPPDVQALSLQRMSFLNQAYQTLKDPGLRRSYLIERSGLAIAKNNSKKGSIPLEITENWFEIQELLFDDPGAAQERLLEFKQQLEAVQWAATNKIAALEDAYDIAPQSAILEQLSDQVLIQNYLSSLGRDVAQKMAR